YLGLLPLLAALFLWRFPRRDLARYLTAMFVLICVASLGPVLHVSGIGVAPWLWLWAVPIPLLNNALPARFMMYAFLVAGLMVALWLAEGEGGPHPNPLPSQGEGIQRFPHHRGAGVQIYRWVLAGVVL